MLLLSMTVLMYRLRCYQTLESIFLCVHVYTSKIYMCWLIGCLVLRNAQICATTTFCWCRLMAYKNKLSPRTGCWQHCLVSAYFWFIDSSYCILRMMELAGIPFITLFLFFFFLKSYFIVLCVCVFVPCVHRYSGGQKRVPNPLELKV